MKFKIYQIGLGVLFCVVAAFSIASVYIGIKAKGATLQFLATRELKGREVDIYRVKGFEDMVISISKPNATGEIVIMNSEKTASFVKVTLAGGRVQEVAAINSSEDYVVIEADSDLERFSSLSRFTPGSDTTLRVQVDRDLDGVMDQEVSIAR